MPEERDRRRNVRINRQAPATVLGLDGTPIPGLCLNFSEGGMLFLGPELPIGTMASFSVRMAGIGTIEVLGEVRRHSETSEGIALGIRFVPLSSANLALLREFMALPF